MTSEGGFGDGVGVQVLRCGYAGEQAEAEPTRELNYKEYL